ncbi:hypothetical protein SESBI_32230 [Sesbania bispinosa]|nr:hypothetical protein SESBI_32230 [Sesbania bispinosa]
MQNELENLVWNGKQLQEKLQKAVKECKMMEMLLTELEEEHDMAIAKVDKLERKLRDQTNENLRLKEIQGKGYWSSKDPNKTDNSENIDDNSNSIPHHIPSRKSNHSGSGVALQDLPMNKDIWEDESITRTKLLKLLKTGPKSGPVPPVIPEMIPTDVQMIEVIDHRRHVALSQTLFSAIFSVIVGAAVWEAKDPCMPLVLALFTVVGMSLKSVLQFFSTIENKTGSDAVALLSFNCFILGTLTYPTLPTVASILDPLVSSFIDKTLNRFGLHSLA